MKGRQYSKGLTLIHHEKLVKMPLNELLLELKTDPRHGLSTAEAVKRLKDYGYNEIPEKRVHPVIRFLSHFWGPIPWMIELAAIISFIVQDWVDFGIILTLLLVNGVVEFWQEYKAESVIEYLKRKMALNTRVLRDGHWSTIPARELVPGDIVKVRIGDIVPADLRILEDTELEVDQSALTGESLPVKKKQGDVLYSGSIIKRGEAVAVVIGTGLNTYFGKTVKLVSEAQTKSELQKMIIKLGDYLIGLAVVVVALMAAVEILLRHQPILHVLKFALVLIVASIPAALPAVLSITMAIGALELARRKAVVTKLVAIEELAGVDVLCSDKTGTLTKNRLSVGEIKALGGKSERDVILFAALASRSENNDPIDNAILEKAEEFGLDTEIMSWQLVKFTPFDPKIKRTEAILKKNGKTLKAVKGAPQVILQLCRASKKTREEVNKIVEELAKDGFRVIAVAAGPPESLELVGIIPLYDPPRDDAKNAVDAIKKMGVRIKMVTGDHISIARYIANMLGIGKRAATMDDVLKLPREKQEEAIENTDVFAQVFPEHKYKIVEALQSRGHLVAMTGDGVNDAPALKKANCGIAVAGATDAARAAADIVLLEPGISVIAEAIRTARRIFQRMESYVVYRLTETIRVLFFMTASILAFSFYPITSTMVILLAILNDIPILMIAYDNVREIRKPAQWNVRGIASLSTALGTTGLVSSFLALWVGVNVFKLSAAVLRSFVFLKLVVAGHSTLFVTRSRRWLWQKPWPSKKLLLAILSTDVIGTFLAAEGIFMTPIGWGLAAFVWIYAIAWMFINDAVKEIVGKRVHEDVE